MRANRSTRSRCRFSPACAGNGRRVGFGIHDESVQPRVCGERCRQRDHGHQEPGSAPRVRGTEPRRCRVAQHDRFSPACAGNGRWCSISRRDTTVQPRVCGERVGVGRNSCFQASGSAPRVRGTVPREAATDSSIAGSAPRVRGTVHWPCEATLSQTVQPRVCGERMRSRSHHETKSGSAPRVRGTAVAGSNRADLRSGSAPRVRGTDSERSVVQPRPRFSPACAGNGSACRNLDRRTFGSAPRVRGTAASGSMTDRPIIGSAPRVRGTGAGQSSMPRTTAVQPRVCGERLATPCGKTDATRFSPACAGNGWRARYTPPTTPVQPRVCGER